MAKSGGEDHQQAGRDEQLRAAGARDAAEQRAQHEPASDNQSEHNNYRLNESPGERATTRTEYADGEQHRHRGDILQQQHPERGAADRAAEALLVRQHLHHDGGGRHRQRRTDDHGEQRRRAKCISDRSDRHGAQHELQQTKAEDQTAHHPQPFERQLQADHEHHHADAEFGDRRDRLGAIQRDGAEQRQAIGQHREAERSHGHADQHEPEHRTEPQPVEQRDHDGGGGQNDQRGLEQPRIEMRVQMSVPVGEQEAVERLRYQSRSLDAGEVARVDLKVFRVRNLLCHRLDR